MKKKLFHSAAFLALLFGAGSVIIACNQPASETVSQKVEWSGVEDIELDMGDPAPNLLLGVTAKQGNKTLKVQIDNERSDEVNTSAAGAFSIYYVAYDGNKAVSEDLNGEYVRTITVSRGTFIDNNDFKTSSKTGWGGNGNGNSEMTWDIDTEKEALVVNIAKSGDEYWQNQVEFNGLSVKANTTYVVSIFAKSETPRNIGASLEVPALGYRCVDTVSVNSVGYKMTTEQYGEYKFYYTASEDYDGVKFGILLGRFNEDDEAANTVYIDKVSITKAEKQANSTGVVFTGETQVKIKEFADYAKIPAVTAVDKNGAAVTLTKEGVVQGTEFNPDLGKATFGEMWKYVDGEGNLSYFRRQINYSAAPERVHPYDTIDGEFEYGLKFWTAEQDAANVVANKEEGTIEITNKEKLPSGEADWRAQLQQNSNGGKLEANHAYVMVVKAKISNKNVTTLRLEFCAGAGNPKAKKDMVFENNDTYQVFESDPFQPTENVEGGGYRVGLLVGEYSEAFKLTVDSIEIKEVEPEVPYVRSTVYETMDGEFEKGLKYWTAEENGNVRITDLKDGTVKIASTQESRAGQPDWTAQLQQNSNGGKLEAGHSYRAVVKVKTTNKDVTTLRLEFCAGAGNPNAKKDMVFEANDTYQTFETAVFTPETEVTGGNYRVGLLVGEYDASYELIVDSIQIVEVK